MRFLLHSLRGLVGSSLLVWLFLSPSATVLGAAARVDEWIEEGKALTRDRRFGEALTLFERALDERPEDPELWKIKAFTLYAAGRHEQAIDVFQRARELSPKDTGVLNGLGMTYLALKRFDEAADVLLRSGVIDTEVGTVHLAAAALTGAGRYDEAVTLYSGLVKRNPNDFQAWKGLGSNLFSLGRYEEAAESFERALQLHPKMPDALSSKGSALMSLGRLEDAIKHFDRALEINPIYSKAWYNKGVALQRLDRHEEAKRCFNRTLKIQPTHRRARAALEEYEQAEAAQSEPKAAPAVSKASGQQGSAAP